MTASLRVIAAEAAVAHAHVQALTYDPLNAAETGFVADVAAYRATLQELERRLATIIAQVSLLFAQYPQHISAQPLMVHWRIKMSSCCCTETSSPSNL